jgi:ABC-type glycerol-3-phosphate transport system substrate-binding protein
MIVSLKQQKELYETIAEDFKAETNLDSVKIEVTGMNNQRQRVIQLVQAGNPPDLVGEAQTEATLYVNSDLALDVTDMMADVSERIGSPADEARVVIDDRDYFIPYWHNISSFWWRHDLAEKEGYSRKEILNADWDLANELAEKMHDPDNNVYGAYVMAGSGSSSTFRDMAWLFTNEGSVCTWDGDRVKVNFHEEPYRTRMIETLEHLKERHQFSPEASDSTWDTAANSIPNGNTASAWYLGFRPKLRSINQERDFVPDVHVGPMPEKRGRKTVASTDGIMPIKGDNPDVARDFMRFFLRPEYFIEILMSITPIHNVPAYPGIYESDQFQQRVDDLEFNVPENDIADDIEQYMAENRKYVKPRIYDTDPPNPYSEVSYTSEPFSGLHQDVLLRDKDPDAVIDQRAEELQALIDKAQG